MGWFVGCGHGHGLGLGGVGGGQRGVGYGWVDGRVSEERMWDNYYHFYIFVACGRSLDPLPHSIEWPNSDITIMWGDRGRKTHMTPARTTDDGHGDNDVGDQ